MTDEIADDVEMGPAMAALNERQRKFVRACIALGQNGYHDNTAAAREAGYTDGPGLRVRAHELAHDTRIQAAIMEETRKRVCLAAAVVATPVLVSIALNEDLGPAHRIRASLALLDRGGLPAQTEHKVTVEHSVNRERMEEIIVRLSGELGVDPAKMLGVNRAAAPMLELKANDEPAIDA